MNISQRPYRGIRDFIAMTSILAIGRKTDKSAHYVHTGDLSWWIFYSDHDDDHWQDHICLWELADGTDGPTQTIGWTLLDPDWRCFDVYLLPELRGTAVEEQVLDWSIKCLAERVRGVGGEHIQTVWVAEHDKERAAQLEQRGFELGEHAMWYLECPLNQDLPEVPLPEGYTLKRVDDAQDILSRAAAAHQAFGSHLPFEEYWPRYQRFTDSPVYLSSLDLVTVAPEGSISSFCIAWPDPINHTGHFEPVGTHPSYQSRGLGRAVVREGLQQLRNCGMERAAVCVETTNPQAIHLYEAVGFKKQYKLLTYQKEI